MQEAICSSLEDYNKQIEQLKEEMNDATRGADNIRNDISALTQRYAVIDREEECGVCLPKLNSVYHINMNQNFGRSKIISTHYPLQCTRFVNVKS